MPESFTRYSVRSSRREMHRERRARWIEWALIAGAVVVIVVFGYLLLSGGIG
jgi:Flp pilus assembly pilin Flp